MYPQPTFIHVKTDHSTDGLFWERTIPTIWNSEQLINDLAEEIKKHYPMAKVEVVATDGIDNVVTDGSIYVTDKVIDLIDKTWLPWVVLTGSELLPDEELQ